MVVSVTLAFMHFVFVGQCEDFKKVSNMANFLFKKWGLFVCMCAKVFAQLIVSMFVYVLFLMCTYIRMFAYVLARILTYLYIFPLSVKGKG